MSDWKINQTIIKYVPKWNIWFGLKPFGLGKKHHAFAQSQTALSSNLTCTDDDDDNDDDGNDNDDKDLNDDDVDDYKDEKDTVSLSNSVWH